MGALTSRQNAGVEEADVVSNHAYKYPPRSGNYFGSHFIMGGERFDTPQPEAYLFGENADLNFLGSRPTPFPYPPPQSNEPTKTLKSLVNIRKESLKFVRCLEPPSKLTIPDTKGSDTLSKGSLYNIEFTFDCDVRCAFTIYYFSTEEVTPTGLVYSSKEPVLTSATYRYKRGAGQQFSQPAHCFQPAAFPDYQLQYNPDTELMPIAIHCVVDEGAEEIRQSHTTIAVAEKQSDGTYVLKALKQKLFVDGLCYLLQEIYGIENKNIEPKRLEGGGEVEGVEGGAPSESSEGEGEGEGEGDGDGGSECVICMCETRDTLILPCRHLCLCNACADSLRYQASNCPICRAPFRALLQIRALVKPNASHPHPHPDHHHLTHESMENIPLGYEPVSLIEALNGPRSKRPPAPAPAAQPPAAADLTDIRAKQAAEALNRCSANGGGKAKPLSKGTDCKPVRDPTSELRMSVLLAREAEGRAARSPLLRAPPPVAAAAAAAAVACPALRTQYIENGDCLEDEEEEGDAAGGGHESERDSAAGDAECEGDSEAERMSPLLTAPQPLPMPTPLPNGVVQNGCAVGCGGGGKMSAGAPGSLHRIYEPGAELDPEPELHLDLEPEPQCEPGLHMLPAARHT